MAKKANLLRNLFKKKKESSEKGWSAGFRMLTIDPKLAFEKIREAGLTVYMDDNHIWGPAEESWQAMKVLADNGDALSAAAIDVEAGIFTWEELGIGRLE